MRILDKNTGIILASGHIPYGANLYLKNGDDVKKGDLITDWDPYNAVILSEVTGNIVFENILEGVPTRLRLTNRPAIRIKSSLNPVSRPRIRLSRSFRRMGKNSGTMIFR
jgi:DNA-directed RNA polymerase subunit beta'